MGFIATSDFTATKINFNIYSGNTTNFAGFEATIAATLYAGNYGDPNFNLLGQASTTIQNSISDTDIILLEANFNADITQGQTVFVAIGFAVNDPSATNYQFSGIVNGGLEIEITT